MNAAVTDRLNAALEGRYRVERELGEGGMATVFLATDVRHRRKVALKVLKPELAAVVGGDRFLSEIDTTAGLQHPHILPLFDSGDADGHVFYVMPYVEGESLRERLDRERQLPVSQAVNIARKVASALEYAHEQGIIHRDIKPANILLSRGEPLVADFGIALALSQAGEGRLTETGLSLGTPHYMSPEQATGERTLDPRSDIYALGSVLYEMLAGEPPFPGPTAQAVLARILTAEPQRLREVRRSIPPHVDAAVARCLEKLPADRFDSAEEFRSALQDEGFRHDPSRAARPTAPAVSRRNAYEWVRDPRSFAALGAAAVLALVAGMLLFRPDATGSDSTFSPPITRVTIPMEEHSLREGDLNLSPDGTMLVYRQEGQNEPLRLRHLDRLESQPMRGTEGGSFPVFSPDGRWVAFTVEDGIRRVSVSGGASMEIAVTSTPAFGLHWGRDGTLVYPTSDGLYRVSAQGGEPERILASTDFSARFPRVLPNGNQVVFTYRPLPAAEGEIRLLELSSGEVRTLIREGMDARYVEPGYLLYGHSSQTVFAAPFDVSAGEVTGPQIPVLSGVRVAAGFGQTAFTASATGSAAYVLGTSTVTENRLVLAAADGSEELLPAPPGAYLGVTVSPDGGRIAYGNEVAEIFIYDLELGTNSQLDFEGAAFVPVWLPRGDSITFTGLAESGTLGDIFLTAVDGDEPARKLLEETSFQLPQDWSPDGSRLLYLTEGGGSRGSDLRIASRDGELITTTAYLQADWEESAGQISPDGRWVAYASDEEGAFEIYVRSFPRPGGKTKISEGGGSDPRWSPDSRSIHYWAGDTLMTASLSTEPGIAVLDRSPVLTGPYAQDSYDVHPDGERFLLVRRPSVQDSETEDEATLVLVVNWVEELRERMRGQ